ncbi:ABC-2 type transport system ATP-binding protein [Microbacteriaceae bacterium SG_E_30_P1]|uniref:ABC-2 type transport system ATP-binding protein n=1 Tax=Antiquaquibacter oligotrophicus TaxID=2880260 RepID=A0ABT6KMX4_9MICO|nr:ABC transporter ATP-binding protein [Antiquaquibacter oligotrophicus]MDH6180519.1 ABC-2 type transport system ATP-binding protein [Antiquaquibacter oligotrophicus]UDF13747.1 ABC transporter ATP-binding protein [Antiquaquibacter oligotrophicus]
MPNRTTIEFSGLSKTFGAVAAVSDLTFSVEPGVVTGFLGPNGAGKTTSLRMLLGLVRPTSGSATFGGTAYRDLERPLATVGTALEASSFHPGRTARKHLAVYAAAAGIPSTRVDAVLALAGMQTYADRRVGGFSLGMRQRLGLASALLGDPGVLVLDEPTNGLDPEGIRWMRGFLRDRAAEGRTVLVSSHVLSEVQQSVDQVVIISRGRAVYQGSLDALDSDSAVRVDAADRRGLAAALAVAGFDVRPTDDALVVSGATAEEVGKLALLAGIPLNLLVAERAGLEDAFLSLVTPAPDPAQGSAGAPPPGYPEPTPVPPTTSSEVTP